MADPPSPELKPSSPFNERDDVWRARGTSVNQLGNQNGEKRGHRRRKLGKKKGRKEEVRLWGVLG
jgi:hypothetical protein